MMGEHVPKLYQLDQATLTLAVRAALKRDSVTVIDWAIQPFGGGASQTLGASFGVFRLTGQAQDQEEIVPWSLVLKILGTVPGSAADDPSSWYYWKPEVWVYQSGILEQLPAGLKAPRCFGVVEQSSHEYWVWFEDVQEAIGRRWPLERYRLAARHLGQFNGAYLAGEPIPMHPWYRPPRTLPYLESARPVIDNLAQISSGPVGGRMLTAHSVERIRRLWAGRERLLGALDRLPRSFGHHDAHRRNLIARKTADGTEETVAVDWSYSGIGAVGVEISLTVASTLRWMEVEASQARVLDQAVFDGYLEGLRAAGWQGDERLARFGYTASAALFAGLGHLGVFLLFLLDEQKWPEAEQILGHPVNDFFAQYAELQPFLLDLGEEAMVLMEVLNLDMR
jgi:hypothetical protein